MSATFNFTKRTFAAIKKIDPDLFDELVAPHGSPESYMYLHRTNHKTLFERSGLLDNPGRSPLVRSVVYDTTQGQDFKHWITDGGSPMLSTELKRKDVETVAILGYRESMLSSYPILEYATYKLNELSLEQWKLGTTPAMIASSILRTIGKGQFNAISIEKIGIPEGLLSAFKDPEVEGALVEFLASQPKIGEKGSFLRHSAHFGSIAYLLLKHGTDQQVKAMTESAAGVVLTDNPTEVYSQLIFCECNQAQPDIQALVTKVSQVFRIDPSAPEFDWGIAKRFDSSNTRGSDALVEFSVNRMASLAEAGKLHQAVGWLHHVLEDAPDIPELDDQARKKFHEAYRHQPQSEKKLTTQLNGNHRLRFAVSLLGPDAFVTEYGKELFASYKASWDNVSTDIGLGGVIGDGLLPDPAVLKEFDLIIPVLDKIDVFWGTSWADDAKTIQNCQELNLAKRMLKRHLERVAGWVGEALTAEQDQALAHKWYDRLEHPFLQLPFVDAMPFDKSLRQRMSPNTQGQQFLRDLGM